MKLKVNEAIARSEANGKKAFSENILSATASNAKTNLLFIVSALHAKQVIRRTIQHFAKNNDPFRDNPFGRAVT